MAEIVPNNLNATNMEKDGFYNVPLNDEQISLLFYFLSDYSVRLLSKLQKFQYLDGNVHSIYEDFKMQYRVLDEIIKSIVETWK